ncbi:MAG: tetrahydrofolate synthase [Spirochaetaceae bacterium]|jgi:dihydrofolate synthase/folylpolyglutamate synthase|nr:tetrahydrofolate synthase [Spirochaetaceae bacterium]
MFMNNSSDIFNWLMHFVNFERTPSRKLFRLETMLSLASFVDHPERFAPVIHIAGSKGKGSVTGMIAAMLEAAGMKTARYHSPHVSDYRERIMSGTGFFPEEVYLDAGAELVGAVEAYSAPEPLTFFELMTLYFFLCARRACVDCVVVETGMGGRLDATNIVDPLLSVITLIELEHTAYLGNTLAAIAGEKAGIIKPKKPLVLAEQEAQALAVFQKAASTLSSPLYYFPDHAHITDIRLSAAGTDFTFTLHERSHELHTALPGAVQAYNAGLAVLAATLAYPDIGDQAIYAGLSGFTLPARFERIKDDPVVIVDGAHTPQSIRHCLDTFAAIYGSGHSLVFGCAADKDTLSLARILLPYFSHIIITRPGTFKESFPQKVYEIFKHELSCGQELLLVEETGAALQKAIELDQPVLGTGSFYLAAELISYVRSA